MKGRWPANIILDGSEEVIDMFPDTGKAKIAYNTLRKNEYNNTSYSITGNVPNLGYGDSGSAARYFIYCPYTEEDLK